MVKIISACKDFISTKKIKMIDMNKYSKTLRYSVRSMFFIFSFIYILFFQKVLIETYLEVYSSSANGLSRTLFLAILLSTVLTLISIPVDKIFKFSDGLFACSFLPSAILLGICTSFSNMNGKQFSVGIWILIAVVTILFMIVCKVLSVRKFSRGVDINSLYANNFLIMVYAVFCTLIIGNTEETLHRTLSMEKYYEHGRYEKVLEVGKNAEEINTDISVLRAKSLSKLNVGEAIPGSQLGDHLFEYKQSGPNIVADTLQSMGAHDNSLEKANRKLAALLLRKNLNEFSDGLQDDLINVLKISSWHPDNMPLYYLQALILAEYKGYAIPQEMDELYPQQSKEVRDLFAEYIKDKETVYSQSKQYRSNYMYKKYSRTYWWFYDFSE